MDLFRKIYHESQFANEQESKGNRYLRQCIFSPSLQNRNLHVQQCQNFNSTFSLG